MINEPIETDEINCPLVIVLAVSGVKQTGFHGPESYPSILSAILKVSRFFVLRFCYEGTTTPYEEIDIDLDDSHVSNTSKSNSIDRPLDRVKSMVNEFMIRDTHTPIDWLLGLRAYGMNIARNTTTTGQIDWNNETISYGNISFSVSDFRGFVYGLIASTRAILFEELLFDNISTHSNQKIPEILWSSIYDNPLDSSLGVNFLNNIQTSMQVADWTRWLNDRIMINDILKNRFRKSDGQ